MKSEPVSVVRVYIREGEHIADKLLRFLRDERAVAGVTVIRGVAGFGEDLKLHTAGLLDLSLDLPVVVEFFDQPEKARHAVEGLISRFDLHHVVLTDGIWYSR